MPNQERFRIYIAALLVLIKDGKILLQKRATDSKYEGGKYDLVGGHFEGHETARHCIIREAEEEANIKLNSDKLEVVHVMHRYYPDREYIEVYLKTDTWDGEIINNEPEECEELSWFALDDLPVNMIPQVKIALENIDKGIFYGEMGWED